MFDFWFYTSYCFEHNPEVASVRARRYHTLTHKQAIELLFFIETPNIGSFILSIIFNKFKVFGQGHHVLMPGVWRHQTKMFAETAFGHSKIGESKGELHVFVLFTFNITEFIAGPVVMFSRIPFKRETLLRGFAVIWIVTKQRIGARLYCQFCLLVSHVIADTMFWLAGRITIK